MRLRAMLLPPGDAEAAVYVGEESRAVVDRFSPAPNRLGEIFPLGFGGSWEVSVGGSAATGYRPLSR